MATTNTSTLSTSETAPSMTTSTRKGVGHAVGTARCVSWWVCMGRGVCCLSSTSSGRSGRCADVSTSSPQWVLCHDGCALTEGHDSSRGSGRFGDVYHIIVLSTFVVVQSLPTRSYLWTANMIFCAVFARNCHFSLRNPQEPILKVKLCLVIHRKSSEN